MPTDSSSSQEENIEFSSGSVNSGSGTLALYIKLRIVSKNSKSIPLSFIIIPSSPIGSDLKSISLYIGNCCLMSSTFLEYWDIDVVKNKLLYFIASG